MKIYLDLCAIQRPLDTPDQIRIVLESEAVLGLIAYCDSGQLELLSSEALVHEGDQCSLPIRKIHTFNFLSYAKSFIQVTERIKNRAANFMDYGTKPLDALHIALAEAGNADYFCTCDDRLLQCAKRVKDLQVKIVNPIEMIQEAEKWLLK